MKTYEQVLEKVELALAKGEYHYCIEFLLPIIESFPLSSKEGVNLRTILITALCGINKREEAKRFCKELLKSYDNKTRENAKYLMEVIDSPDIKKPENWNIEFESDPSINKQSLSSLRKKTKVEKEKKFINVINTPTGETKPFQKGFSLIIFKTFLVFSRLRFLFFREKLDSPCAISASGKISLIFSSNFNCQGNFFIYLLSITKLLVIESSSLRSRVSSTLTQPLKSGINNNSIKKIISEKPF